MRVIYDSPHRRRSYETEVPCEADPVPFAEALIAKAIEEEGVQLTVGEELPWCHADGSPIT